MSDVHPPTSDTPFTADTESTTSTNTAATTVEKARPSLSVTNNTISILRLSGHTTIIDIDGIFDVDGQRTKISPIDWQNINRTWIGNFSVVGLTYKLEIKIDESLPRIFFRVKSTCDRKTTLGHEEVSLFIRDTQNAEILTRNMKVTPLESIRKNAYLVDRWTPLELKIHTSDGPLTLAESSGFESTVVERKENGIAVHLEMNDYRNHPFRPYAGCSRAYDSKLKHLMLDAKTYSVGETATYEVQLWLSDFMPLRPARFSFGRRAALVLTSHADQSSTSKSRALLFGHSDASHPSFGKKGFASRGLGMTFSAFAEGKAGSDISDPNFRELLIHAENAGIEICPHSTTPKEETQSDVKTNLKKYGDFNLATWIDHQPETNCEAIGNSAGLFDTRSPFNTLPLLTESGIRYFWSIPDISPPGGLNMFGPDNPVYRPTILYPNPRLASHGTRPWMFKTIWMFMPLDRFLKRYDDKKLDRLIVSKGIHIAHVYPDTFRSHGKFAGRSLLKEDKGGNYMIRDDADELFIRLARLQNQKKLWVTSMRALGDYLIRSREVDILYHPDGTVSVVSQVSISGWTFSIPKRNVAIEIDGKRWEKVSYDEHETIVWMDLKAGIERQIIIVVS